MKATEQYFSVVLFILLFKVSRTLAQPDMQIWDVICSKRFTIIQRWKTGNTCLSQFTLLSALLQFPPELCGKNKCINSIKSTKVQRELRRIQRKGEPFLIVSAGFTVHDVNLHKWNWTDVQECHTQVKVSICPLFLSLFCVRVAKIFEGKTSMFLLLVTHIQDGVILCLPFTIFNKFLKIPKPFPQTKLCMVWKIVKSSIALLNLTKFWTKAHAQNCRYFSPTVLRSTREP